MSGSSRLGDLAARRHDCAPGLGGCQMGLDYSVNGSRASRDSAPGRAHSFNSPLDLNGVEVRIERFKDYELGRDALRYLKRDPAPNTVARK